MKNQEIGVLQVSKKGDFDKLGGKNQRSFQTDPVRAKMALFGVIFGGRGSQNTISGPSKKGVFTTLKQVIWAYFGLNHVINTQKRV